MRYALLFAVVFLSACVQNAPKGEELRLSMSLSPAVVFASAKATVYFDAQNAGAATIKDLQLDVFDTGSLLAESACELKSGYLLPGQIASLSCSLKAPAPVSSQQTETIRGRARFTSVLPVLQTFDMMKESAYSREKLAGNIRTGPKSYTYRDGNMEVLVEFSDSLPVVFREGKKYYVYFTIKNTGAGSAGSITFGKNFRVITENDLRFSNTREAVVSGKMIDLLQQIVGTADAEGLACNDALCCRDFRTIYINGKEFPKITCELKMPDKLKPSDKDQLVDYQFIVPLVYEYEMRASAELQVVK